MKTKTSQDIVQFLDTDFFLKWYRRSRDIRAEQEAVLQRREGLFSQLSMLRFQSESIRQKAETLLMRAGQWEEKSALALSKLADLENDSFQAVSDFEKQRSKASGAWADRDCVDQDVESLRQKIFLVQSRMKAAEKYHSDDVDRMRDELNAARAHLEARLQQLQVADRRMKNEENKRTAIWSRVETRWSDSLRASLARSEYLYLAKRDRALAETLLYSADQEQKRDQTLREQLKKISIQEHGLEDALQTHLFEAEKDFDCILLSEFLYWPSSDDVGSAYAVPLRRDQQLHNVDLEPLRVYRVARTRGVEFLEPILLDGAEIGPDPRLTAFFGRSA